MCLHSHRNESTDISVSSGFVLTVPWKSKEPTGYLFNRDCASIYLLTYASQKTLVIHELDLWLGMYL